MWILADMGGRYVLGLVLKLAWPVDKMSNNWFETTSCATMQSGKQSNKSKGCMTHVPSDNDEAPHLPDHEALSIPCTCYQVLASGNFAFSSKILNIAPPPSELLEASDALQPLLDTPISCDPVDINPSQLEPAYIEHLSKEFVTVKCQHVNVSTLLFC